MAIHHSRGCAYHASLFPSKIVLLRRSFLALEFQTLLFTARFSAPFPIWTFYIMSAQFYQTIVSSILLDPLVEVLPKASNINATLGEGMRLTSYW